MNAATSVLWMNGAFGGGKTCACRALRALDPRWRLADPEILGAFLRDAEARNGQDFQEHPGWTRLVVAGLLALDPTPDRPVAVPMSIHNEQVWDAIEAGLAEGGLRTTHLFVDGPVAAIAERIESAFAGSGEEAGSAEVRAFRFARLPAYLAAKDWLRNRATVIGSASMAPTEVASAMLRIVAAREEDRDRGQVSAPSCSATE
ncbi:MAG: hypothetical protein M3O32_08640 [Actinomycetota bacterium]|nr:hypothetical protein [Actinomycetota bacterium]